MAYRCCGGAGAKPALLLRASNEAVRSYWLEDFKQLNPGKAALSALPGGRDQAVIIYCSRDPFCRPSRSHS